MQERVVLNGQGIAAVRRRTTTVEGKVWVGVDGETQDVGDSG